jgi:hypothetical protein
VTGLGGRIRDAEAVVFQGRQAELDTVLTALTAPGRLPGVISLTGPPGIGKTAFVYALERACRARGAADVRIVDSRDFPHTLAGLVSTAKDIDSQRPSLLVFDTFEEMRDLEERFWNRFLPGLRGPVLVLLSGRPSPDAGVRPPGWRLVADEIVLTPLPDGQARLLLGHLGVTGEAAASSIVDLAGGSPLLLCVAAEVYRSGAMRDAADLGVPGMIGRSLIARMTRELRRPDVRELLQAASLVRTFDEELLAAMVDGVTPESFDALCDLTVVRPTAAGACLHDVVRQTVSAEVRWRAPERYARLRRRAARHLLGRSADGDRGLVVPELLHLIGETVGPRRFFADARDRGVSLRPAHEGDLAGLEHLCRAGTHNFGWHADQMLRELRADFAVAMDWFVVATDQDRVVAYSYSLPLHRQTWPAVAGARGRFRAALPSAESAAIARAAPDRPAAFLIAGTVALGSHRSAEPALRFATFTNRHVRAPSVSRSYVLMPGDSPFEAAAVSLGMSRRLAGIEMAPGEPPADAWTLDYGERGFPSWVQRSLNLPEQESPLDLVPGDVLAGQVKLALEDLYRPESLAQSPLVRLRCVDQGAGLAPGLRALLVHARRRPPALDGRRARRALPGLPPFRPGRLRRPASRRGQGRHRPRPAHPGPGAGRALARRMPAGGRGRPVGHLLDQAPQRVLEVAHRHHLVKREADGGEFAGQVLGVGLGPGRHLPVPVDVGPVPVVLPVLRQQDQRGRVRRLGREGQVQQDERVRVPVLDEAGGVERDPGDHQHRLAGQEPPGPQKPGDGLRHPPERVGVVPGTDRRRAARNRQGGPLAEAA